MPGSFRFGVPNGGLERHRGSVQCRGRPRQDPPIRFPRLGHQEWSVSVLIFEVVHSLKGTSSFRIPEARHHQQRLCIGILELGVQTALLQSKRGIGPPDLENEQRDGLHTMGVVPFLSKHLFLSWTFYEAINKCLQINLRIKVRV